MNNQELQQHILSTYNSLRLGMIIIGAATPILVVLWGWWWNIEWQPSISNYYFAPRGNVWEYSPYPVRVLFGGIMFAVGSFLYLYKGFTKWENRLLNVAGLAAIGVAMFPMYAETGYIPISNKLHVGCAFILFFCIGATAVFCHNATLQWVADEQKRKKYKAIYFVIGALMVVSPFIGIAMAYASQAVANRIYWIEAAGIWAFSAYWITKSLELNETEMELNAVKGNIDTSTPHKRGVLPNGVSRYQTEGLEPGHSSRSIPH